MTHSVATPGSAPSSAAHSTELPALALLGPDGNPEIRRFLSQPAPSNHIVQFYDDDGYLFEHVGHFIGAGLAGGEPTVVIATPPHRAGFNHRLTQSAFDVDRASASGAYVELDARKTLAEFMVDGMPDADRFNRVLGGVMDRMKAGRSGVRLRAYGEMVDVLWKDGNRQGAIRLEELWNALGEQHSFSLLCAYSMGNFQRAGDEGEFADLCRSHTHVIPAESYSQLEGHDARLREITFLQQRARALESEIEHRRELEQTLREALAREQDARAEAEKAVRYNELFAGMLGHDLRNPLSAISTAAYYIARAGSDVKARTAASRIVTSSERMARMIEQLLDFTRIRVGDGLAIRRTRVDLAELCLRIKEELEVAHPDRAIHLDVRGDTIGDWDYDRMLQVFSNLVGNALHHGASGCTIRIGADGTDAQSVVVTVHNEGIVSADVVPVLFEPFRGITKDRKTSGLGLGLYITRQIVSAHGGTVDVLSSEVDGTTFRVELPRGLSPRRL